LEARWRRVIALISNAVSTGISLHSTSAPGTRNSAFTFYRSPPFDAVGEAGVRERMAALFAAASRRHHPPDARASLVASFVAGDPVQHLGGPNGSRGWSPNG
jgi:hypothetical protein